MLSVFSEKDRVILDLHGRRDTSAVTWKDGEPFMETLRRCADEAERWTGSPTLMTEAWAIKVESYDGYVYFRFTSPTVGLPERVPFTAVAARRLADMIEFRLPQAEYKMKFEFPRRRRFSKN